MAGGGLIWLWQEAAAAATTRPGAGYWPATLDRGPHKRKRRREYEVIGVSRRQSVAREIERKAPAPFDDTEILLILLDEL